MALTPEQLTEIVECEDCLEGLDDATKQAIVRAAMVDNKGPLHATVEAKRIKVLGQQARAAAGAELAGRVGLVPKVRPPVSDAVASLVAKFGKEKIQAAVDKAVEETVVRLAENAGAEAVQTALDDIE